MKMFLLYGHGFPPENDCCIQVYAQICFLSIKSREIVGFAKDIVYNTSNVRKGFFFGQFMVQCCSGQEYHFSWDGLHEEELCSVRYDHS